MIIKNVQIFQEDGTFRPGDLFTENGRIAQAPSDETIFDGNGAYAIPGLTDIHFHGCAGCDFSDATPEALQTIADYELRHGITQICPASMSLPRTDLLAIARNAAAFSGKPGAELVGFHMEGPFLSPEKKGAHDARWLCSPDPVLFREIQQASGGLCRIVSIAPELPGAPEFIQTFRNEVVLSEAHSAADYDTAMRGFEAGASHVTHLYNAMMPFTHRAPGLIGAAFDTPGCEAELIGDGIHISPSAVRAAFRLFGDDRMILISDSMRATGLADGIYSLGGQEVHVTGSLATLADGTIAGSATNLMDCVRRVVSMGIPFGTAVKCAALNPARSIGIDSRFGSLTPGKTANIVLLDSDLRLQAVFQNGHLISTEQD